ncbi:MAG: hypothetical protein AAGF54_16285 [Pseudomonadota bacterium]
MKKSIGLENVPRILKKPFWTDSFVWWGVLVAIFWCSVLWWLLA